MLLFFLSKRKIGGPGSLSFDAEEPARCALGYRHGLKAAALGAHFFPCDILAEVSEDKVRRRAAILGVVVLAAGGDGVLDVLVVMNIFLEHGLDPRLHPSGWGAAAKGAVSGKQTVRQH